MTTQKRLLAQLMFLSIGCLLLLVLFTPSSISAKEKSEPAVQDAAEKACANQDSKSEKSACRIGYRGGYSGNKALVDVCQGRATFGPKDQAACGDGYGKGFSQSDKDGVDKKKDNPKAEKEETGPFFTPASESKDGDECGNKGTVKTRFNFGCLGDKGPDNMGPIEDLVYSFVRFMSVGVGIVIVISIILAGIQYSASQGNPEATQKSKNRIRSAFIGLVTYIFAFSLLQYLVPGGVFAGSMMIPSTVIIEGLI